MLAPWCPDGEATAPGTLFRPGGAAALFLGAGGGTGDLPRFALTVHIEVCYLDIWVPQKLPQIFTVIVNICLWKVA